MQTMVVYAIGLLAVVYLASTVWKKVKGQGGCCSSEGGCDGCGSASKCK